MRPPARRQIWARHWVDITGLGSFIIEWLVYIYLLTLEHSAYGRDSLGVAICPRARKLRKPL
ncbi:hypothetical protein JJB98_21490 [Bradyrhizobium diazoefficiens]|nr:hypothetical protein [Bradyrhizobium diazoefficiens]QQO24829.1 hypothetical protein JJB98_21490 [Bradyrhizobium diazoefficiens]